MTETDGKSLNAAAAPAQEAPQTGADLGALSEFLRGNAEAGIVADGNGRILYLNPPAARLLGYEGAGASVRRLTDIMAPHDAASFRARMARRAPSAQSAVLGQRIRANARRRNGSLAPVEISVSGVRLLQGQVFVGILRDLSEATHLQAQSEQEQRLADLLIETAPALVVILDAQGRVIRCNERLLSLLGRQRREVLLHDWLQLAMPTAARTALRAQFDAAMIGRPSPEVWTAGMLDSDGAERTIEWRGSVLQEGGERIGMICIGLDATDRLRNEALIVHAQKMEAVGRLSGGIAHDFNNLLMGVIGCCRMAAELVGDEHPARPLIDEIRTSSERSVQLTRRLLTFSRREPAAWVVLDLHQSVRSIVALAQQLVGADILMEVQLVGATAPVLGDPVQVEQMLMNLIINARDAMPDGGRLTIRVEGAGNGPCQGRTAGAAAPQAVRLSVGDTGVGMTKEVQARAFEPFFTTKGADAGSGLGLSTVFGIVQRMQGEIQVRSEPGRGTTFVFEFPRTDVLPRTEAAAAAKATTSSGRERILLVEDEGLVRTTLTNALSKLGYQVLAAASAADARELVASGAQFDLLLSDVVLPDQSGPDFAAGLREARPDLKALFMSAHAHEHLVEQGRLRPEDVSLEKPFHTEDLEQALRRILDADPGAQAADGG